MITVFACLRTAEKFVHVAEKFADRDTIAIAKAQATAITHGALDAVDETGYQTLLSYLFWWPTFKRKSIKGILSVVSAQSDS